MTIENLKALVKGVDLTLYQKALALDELNMVDKLLKDQPKEIDTKSAEDILSKYETYVKISQPYNTTPIFLKENVLKAMEEYASSQPVTVSEEEISNAAFDLSEKHPDIVAAITDNYFIKGAKWMQKQLTSPQREKDESKQMQQEAIKDRLKRNIGGEIPPRLGSGVNPPKK